MKTHKEIQVITKYTGHPYQDEAYSVMLALILAFIFSGIMVLKPKKKVDKAE